MPATATDRLAGLTASVAVKPPCAAVTVFDIPLTGLFTVGTVTLQEGDRVLVRAQTDATENGIYNASTSDWTRALDFDGARDVVTGTVVLVRNGVADGVMYEVITLGDIEIGTTPITFHLHDDPTIVYSQNAAEISTGIIPTNPAFFPPIGVDVRRFGVMGDGVTDDTSAMLRAILTGQPLDIGNLSIKVTSRLTFNVNGQRIFGRGGTFLFAGSASDRLLDVVANDVQFHGVTFSGNGRQVKAGLCYWSDNAARPKAIGCRFTNIVGTHVGGTTTLNSNNQYGLIISPYGVEGLVIEGCSFDNISNDNSGVNGTTPTTGLGYTGGIIFIQENFIDPVSVQGVPTSGVIHGCYFRNIITVLQNGLSVGNQNLFMDADGIRTYGGATVTIRLPVMVSDCVFLDCAKRAIKTSTTAEMQIHNCNVIATSALQYPMAETIKLYGDDIVLDGWNISSLTGSPPGIAVTAHECVNLRVNNVVAGRVSQLMSIIPTTTSAVIAGWRVSNMRCNNIQPVQGGSIGFGVSSDTLCDHFEDCVFENIDIEASGSLHQMLAGSFVANTARVEVALRNWKIVGGDLKIAGYGYTLHDMYHEINDTSYVSSVSNRGILEAGQTPGTAATRDSIVNGYNINIKAITAGYLSGSRQYFTAIYGDRTKVSNFRIVVPESTDATFAHAQFDGSEYTLENFEYSGPGRIENGAFEGSTKVRFTVDGARRIGGTNSTATFLYFNNCEDCFISNVADYRLTSAASITIAGGTIRGGRTYAYIIDGVASLSSNGSVVSDGGTLAHQANVQKF